MLMVRAIRLENKFLHPVCLNVDFVERRVVLLGLSILESRQTRDYPTQPNPKTRATWRTSQWLI
jgi:hypothetical protein